MLYEAELGEHIRPFIERMKKEMTLLLEDNRRCRFNGVDFTVWQDSNVQDVGLIYSLSKENYQNLNTQNTYSFIV